MYTKTRIYGEIVIDNIPSSKTLENYFLKWMEDAHVSEVKIIKSI